MASCDPSLHAPTVTSLLSDVRIPMLFGMASDPRRPVRGHRSSAAAVIVRLQYVHLGTPNATDCRLRKFGVWDLRRFREERERLLRLPAIPVLETVVSYCNCPGRSDLRRVRDRKS